MLDINVLKKEVLIILEHDGKFTSNEQYYFACGVALNAILYTKEYDEKLENSIIKELQKYEELKDIIITINNLIELNLSYIEQLPRYKKNLFTNILNFEPVISLSIDEFKEYLNLGLENSLFYFDTMPIAVGQNTKKHSVKLNVIRYHISKNK
jgi:hypothetical protein